MGSQRSVEREMTPEVRRGVVAWVAKAILGVVFFGVLLFLAAGSVRWLWGWVFIGLFMLVSAVNVWLLLPTNPALLADRSRGIRAGTKDWDKVITAFAAGLLPMAAWVLSGLDERFGWSAPGMSTALHVGGALFFALGWAMLLWATASNAYFSVTVRIQDDRGHTVQTGGPYQVVRHPGYVGAIVYQLATPFLLGSWWALIPMAITLPLYVLRTALEDRTLQAELPGYAEYAVQTRYRLLPGVW
jgi:protein-S-isoprenylcysteine O-methyltransferase Ste14